MQVLSIVGDQCCGERIKQDWKRKNWGKGILCYKGWLGKDSLKR
jgi:hypothetical protein